MLKHEATVLCVAGAMLLLTVAQYVEIPKGFFPTEDTGIVQGISQAPESISFAGMSGKQEQLTEVILKDPAVASLSSFIGADGTNSTLNSGRIQINLKPLSQRHMTAEEVSVRLQRSVDRIPGIHLYLQPVQDLTVDDQVTRTEYQYTLEDPDVAELNRYSGDMLAELRKLPELSDVASDQQNNGLSLHLDIDRATASRLSITPDQIDSTLYDAFGQRQVSTLYTQSNQYHVILETLPSFQRSPQNLRDVYIQGSAGTSNAAQSTSGRTTASSGVVSTITASSSSGLSSSTPSSSLSLGSSGNSATVGTPSASPSSTTSSNTSLGTSTPTSATSSSSENSSSASNTTSTAATPVPLSAITSVSLKPSPLTMNHQGQFPVVTISFNVAAGYSLGQATAAIERAKRRVNPPMSVQARFQGTAAAFLAIGSNEVLLICAALGAVYVVLGILYESFIHPLTILSTLPSAGVGALLALRLFHQNLDVIAIIGIILLLGIVKKNGILIVDFALEAERVRKLNPAEAVYEASLLRFRPIMMTTLCALFAGVPLAFGSGIGSELRRPLGIAMVGGLLLSQALTLYTKPVIYVLFDRLSRRLAPWANGSESPNLAADPE